MKRYSSYLASTPFTHAPLRPPASGGRSSIRAQEHASLTAELGELLPAQEDEVVGGTLEDARCYVMPSTLGENSGLGLFAGVDIPRNQARQHPGPSALSPLTAPCSRQGSAEGFAAYRPYTLPLPLLPPLPLPLPLILRLVILQNITWYAGPILYREQLSEDRDTSYILRLPNSGGGDC